MESETENSSKIAAIRLSKHYPNYINALLIKAELLTKQYRHLDNKECEEAKKAKRKNGRWLMHISTA